MTAADLIEHTETAPAPAPKRRLSFRPVLAPLPWLVPVAGLVVGLRWTGVPAADIAIYAGYLVAYVALPGTLVHRLLRGSRGNVPEDVGYGAATGLLLQLVVWAVAAGTGQQQLLRWWILPVVLAFVVVPKWRRHWRVTDLRPLPLRWSWLVAVSMLLPVGTAVGVWVSTPLPPAAAVYYPDVMYHLSLVHEMTRSWPFEVPQLAGDTLRYHYLSDADMAAAHLISGLDPATIMLRLWPVPIGAIAILAFAALTREVTGTWWTGPLGGAAAVVGLPLALGNRVPGAGGPAFTYLSPSQTYALPVLALFAAIAVDALRRRPLNGGWLLVPVLAFAAAGTKSSALPPLAAGLALGAVVALVAHRRIPWAVLGLLVATVTGMLAGLRFFAGGGAGVLSLQPLAVLRFMDPYSRTIGAFDSVDAGDTLLPLGLVYTNSEGWWFVAGLIGWWLLVQTPRLLGWFGIGARRIRTDPVGWFLGGTVAAGAVASWLFFHPAASQVYFYLCALPFGAILTVWFAADLARRRMTFFLGFLAGVLWVVYAPEVLLPEKDSFVAWQDALYMPVVHTLVAVGAAFLLAVVVVCIVRRGFPVRRLALAGIAAVAAATVGGGLANSAVGPVERIQQVLAWPPGAEPDKLIGKAESAAALWLFENTGRDDVVATNVHCTPVYRFKNCDSRAFWVSGLGGRRTVVESWGYSDATVAANGRDERKYMLQPPPYPSVRDQNDSVFADADPADLAYLRERYGVRWLFADSRAGPVSLQLTYIATLRYRSGPVSIYEVP
ncbi:hypothetical protein [Jidongwangia harbinensis]|uniref:hypothetical protein n=1 Tax=Jidongwangia harbinensis TaxID=2878561 RepID=UPI001CD974F7|nr:hypothetical protein [Jidongwangia harbinensis]MCA2214436.1 hypothetical protein [Jidongwangia harbinensis]